MIEMPIRVFVSSTWIDLQVERKAIEDELHRLAQVQFKGMECFGSRDPPPKDVSLQELRRSELYIGVFGGRYGSGITELEHQTAQDLSIPCFIYIKDECADEGETDPVQVQKLIELKRRLRNQHTCSRFATPQELAAMVRRDISHWLQSQQALLPWECGAQIQNFLAEYLGTEDRIVPFGGRDGELAQLDQWLDDPQEPPLFLLWSPAGRGKSALLARWSERLCQRTDLRVALFPISIRFGTSRAAVFFSALVARLARFHGFPISQSPDAPADVWRRLLAELLMRSLPDGRTLVLILDGIDEAADWIPGPDLFPRPLGSRIRIVASARPLAEDGDHSGWLRRLGWQNRGTVRTMALPLLTCDGVQAAFRSMGTSFDHVAMQGDVFSELHRLTRGDPLLVDLYVQELFSRDKSPSTVDAEVLKEFQPGLRFYFDRWWSEQRLKWQPATPDREPSVRAVLDILSAALGPISRDDILALALPQAQLGSHELSSAIEVLARWVLGDGERQGYTFTHPRLAEYFRENLSSSERTELSSRFLHFGKCALEDIRTKRRQPRDISSYAVQYYGAHLQMAAAPPEDLLGLVCSEWRQAWYELEGTYSGFLGDVARARLAAQNTDQLLAENDERPRHIGGQIRCAIFEASVRTAASNVPSDLLVALVANRVWSPIQGLGYARLISSPTRRVETTVCLIPYLPLSILPDVYKELIETSRTIESEFERGNVLQTLVHELPVPFSLEVLESMRMSKDSFGTALTAEAQSLPEGYRIEALERALKLESFATRVAVLARLIDLLPEPHKAQAMEAAFASLARIEDSVERFHAVQNLHPWLSEQARHEALADAWDSVLQMPHRQRRVAALIQLVVSVAGPSRDELLLVALDVVRKTALDSEGHLSALVQLAPHLPAATKREVFAHILAAIRDDGKNRHQALLPQIVSHLPEELLTQGFDLAKRITEDYQKAPIFRDLASRATGELLNSILSEAQKLPGYELSILLAAISSSHANDVTHAQQRALAVARASSNRATTLAQVATRLPESGRRALLLEALVASQEIHDEPYQAATLAAVSLVCPLPSVLELLTEATLVAGRSPVDSDVLVDMMRNCANAAMRLPESARPLICEALLAATRKFRSSETRFRAFEVLLPHLPPRVRDAELADLQEVLTAGKYGQPRAYTLAELARLGGHVSARVRTRIAADAIAAARRLGQKDSMQFLPQLSGYLPWYLRRRLVAEVEQTLFDALRGHSMEVAHGLAALAPYVPFWRRKRLLKQALDTFSGYANCGRPSTIVVAAFAPHLSAREKTRVLAEALELARAIASERPRFCQEGEMSQQSNLNAKVQMITLLLPHFRKKDRDVLASELLDLAREIEDPWPRFSALSELVPFLPESSRGDVLSALVALAQNACLSGWEFASRFAAIAEYLPEGLLAESLMLAVSIRDERSRRLALTSVATRLKKAPGRTLFELWNLAFPRMAHRERRELLSDLTTILGPLAQLGGEEAACDTCQAVHDACHA